MRRGEEVILHAVKGERGGDGEVGRHHYVCNVSRIIIHGIVPSTMSDVDGNTFSSSSISTFIITNVAISSNRSIGGCKVHPNSRIKHPHVVDIFSSDGESLHP